MLHSRAKEDNRFSQDNQAYIAIETELGRDSTRADCRYSELECA
jgi:hypothetical protein